MVRQTCAVLLAMSLFGCTTFDEVERSEPFYTGEFSGDYQSVSACITLAWNGLVGGRFQQIVDPSKKSAFIIGTPGTFTAVHVSHTTIRQIEEDRVLVEYRKPPRLFGTPSWVWESVEDCGRGEA